MKTKNLIGPILLATSGAVVFGGIDYGIHLIDRNGGPYRVHTKVHSHYDKYREPASDTSYWEHPEKDYYTVTLRNYTSDSWFGREIKVDVSEKTYNNINVGDFLVDKPYEED